MKHKILLIGAPNSGKTSLFNWLTGRRHRVVNYPGSTVDYSVGDSLSQYGEVLQVFDSPGSYSLSPKSPEEEVTLNLLNSPDHHFSALVVVVDVTQMERQLPFVEQLKEVGIPLVVALTMRDLLAEDNLNSPVKELSDLVGCPVVAVDGRLGAGVSDLAKVVLQSVMRSERRDTRAWDISKYTEAVHRASDWVSGLFSSELSVQKRTEALDRWVLHPFWGILIFLLVMSLLFSSIFWLAAPMMDGVDGAFSALAQWSSTVLPEGLWAEFVADGLIVSIGAVMVFVPQIFVLFLGICWLEESGYLARAATVVDRPLSRVGLTGRSFVPMLSGFACAVPAILAARTISSPKVRWLTVFILPFMTCSARLPVYALLLSFLFFGQSSFWPGIILALLYIGAVLVSLLASRLLSAVIPQGRRDIFAMELPFFRRPSLTGVLRQAVSRTQHYVVKSGPVIFSFAVLIWLASTFPRYDLKGADRLTHSFAGVAGQVLEPAFEPIGADWRVGVGLISAFAAREVFVSTLAVVLNVAQEEEGDEDSIRSSLIANMRGATTKEGRLLFTPASVGALLVFFMLALQCMSTVGVVVREMGSWKYAMVQLFAMNALAYFLAFLTFQGLRLLGLDA